MDESDKTRYGQALDMTARIAVAHQAEFDQMPSGDKRVAAREQLARIVTGFVKTGAIPDMSPLSEEQQGLVKSIQTVLKLYAAKAAFADQPKRGSMYEAQLYRSQLEHRGQPETRVKARELAESLVFTAAEQLAVEELQTQTPSPVSHV